MFSTSKDKKPQSLRGYFVHKLQKCKRANKMKEEGIHYEPFKEVIIMECTRFSTPDDLARFANVAAGGKPTGIYWAKGVAFIYFPLPATTDVAVRSVMEEKKLYWAFVSYALMPKYSPLIETKEKIIVPVIDMSTSPLFSKAAEWLRENGAKIS